MQSALPYFEYRLTIVSIPFIIIIVGHPRLVGRHFQPVVQLAATTSESTQAYVKKTTNFFCFPSPLAYPDRSSHNDHLLITYLLKPFEQGRTCSLLSVGEELGICCHIVQCLCSILFHLIFERLNITVEEVENVCQSCIMWNNVDLPTPKKKDMHAHLTCNSLEYILLGLLHQNSVQLPPQFRHHDLIERYGDRLRA